MLQTSNEITVVDPAARRVPVLDLVGGSRAAAPPVRFEVDHGAGYELLVVANAFDNRAEWSTYALPHAWYDGIAAAVAQARSGRGRSRAVGGPQCWGPLACLIAAAPDRDDVDGVLDHLGSLPAAAVYTALVDGQLPMGARRAFADAVAEAATGTSARRAALAKRLRASTEVGDDAERGTLAALARREPSALAEDVLATLRAVRAACADHLAQRAPALAHDAEVVRERTLGLPIAQAIESATNGVRYVPEAEVRRVLVVPQVAMRPWVVITGDDDTRIFLYAAAEESLEVDWDAPPLRLVAMAKALAEEQRLRILRRLAGGSASLGQLAEHLAIAKSTVHHHTVVLRAAGLLTVELGADRELSLRQGAAAEVERLLDDYLRRGRR